MNRRRFLELTGLTGLGLFGTACATVVTFEDDASAPSPDAARDAAREVSPDVLVAVDAPPRTDGQRPALFTIHQSFTVLLNDSSCSGHSHRVTVVAAAYPDDTPVRYMGGSHLLEFRPSELVQLERGERIPFATSGNGPGHAHCGTAWRTSVGPEEPNRPDACTPRGTALCERP